jgi:hypothetical protein
MSKKRIITLSELKQINPYQYGKIITALNRNRVKPKNEPKKRNFNSDFGKNEIMKYITNRILNN